jgi:hypothetical protein
MPTLNLYHKGMNFCQESKTNYVYYSMMDIYSVVRLSVSTNAAAKWVA